MIALDDDVPYLSGATNAFDMNNQINAASSIRCLIVTVGWSVYAISYVFNYQGCREGRRPQILRSYFGKVFVIAEFLNTNVCALGLDCRGIAPTAFVKSRHDELLRWTAVALP